MNFCPIIVTLWWFSFFFFFLFFSLVGYKFINCLNTLSLFLTRKLTVISFPISYQWGKCHVKRDLNIFKDFLNKTCNLVCGIGKAFTKVQCELIFPKSYELMILRTVVVLFFRTESRAIRGLKKAEHYNLLSLTYGFKLGRKQFGLFTRWTR